MNRDLFTIVIPSIRQYSIAFFLKSWEKEFTGTHLIVVEDHLRKTFDLPSWVKHYSWKEIDEELEKNSWIISRHNASIRSFGFLKAWEKKSEFVLTLDDDCLPEKRYKKGGFLKEIIGHLNKGWGNDSWWNTMGGKVYPRGFPYKIRNRLQKTALHHGLWSNVPDLDGVTAQKLKDLRTKPFLKVEKIPYGKYFPMCTMNLAFRREILPTMYLLLMGEDKNGNKWPYDRFDDIWSGIFVKKICDHLGFAISSGSPSVSHIKASNTKTNIKKEKSGLPINEWLWRKVENIPLYSNSVASCYIELAEGISKIGGYWKKLGKAMQIWASFFV